MSNPSYIPLALVLITVGWLAAPGAAEAHGDGAVTPENVWSAWNFSPVVLLALVGAAALYARGLRRLWQKAGVGQGVRRWQAACFGGALLALAVALVSPLDAMAGSLFSAHMVQHLIFIIIAGPLLVLAAPLYVMLWTFAPGSRKALGRWWNDSSAVQAVAHFATHPLFTWTFFAVTVWFWHIPLFYEAALESHLIHALEHVNFLLASVLYCWVLISPVGRRRLTRGMGVLYLFATSIHGSLLGALITFSPRPWFSAYLETTQAWHLSPIEDQQLAGLIMWVPVGFIYVVFAALLFVLWLRDVDGEVQRAEQRRAGRLAASPLFPPTAEEER